MEIPCTNKVLVSCRIVTCRLLCPPIHRHWHGLLLAQPVHTETEGSETPAFL